MSQLANRPVAKLNGIGNEIAVLDLRGTGLTVSGPEARAISRGEGLAFDQLMVLHEPRSAGADAFMTIYNRDGSQAEACGNGTRCVAFILTRGTPREKLVLETAAARLECLRRAETIFTVDMGRPRFAWNEIPLREPFHDTRKIELQIGPIDAPTLHTPSAVNMAIRMRSFGSTISRPTILRKSAPCSKIIRFFPSAPIYRLPMSLHARTSPKSLERGTGLTRACGSAACAALVAAARNGLTDHRAIVSLPGGDLDIEWRESDGSVAMTGPVEFEFETRLDPDLFKDIAA